MLRFGLEMGENIFWELEMSSFNNWVGGALVPSLLFCLTIFGQAATADAEEIRGLVQDALGRPIAAASLNLKTSAGDTVGRTQTDAKGSFTFSNIPLNTYALIAEKKGFQVDSSIVTVENGKNSSTTVTLTSEKDLEVQITAERLNQARNGLSPKTGGSVYSFDAANIDNLPLGDSTPMNQVLLQAPGVVNDSYGQFHVRGDHANIQYRINGVILPEGISGFGQALDTRFAQKVDLLTGALPAQYGDRTAGIVEITTKNNFEAGGSADLYMGSNQTYNPSFEYGNTNGNLTYFVDGSFLGNNVGIENPTSSVNPIHDNTTQEKGFAYLSYLLNSTTKLSFMFGSYDGRFQIPNNPGQPTYATLNGIASVPGLPATYNSATLNDQQSETNRFGVVALQSSLNDDVDYQVSLFTRYSSFHYMPDVTGGLAFNGVASDLFKSSSSSGIQADGSDRLNSNHTLRMGVFGSSENVVSNNTSTVFDVSGSAVSGSPYPIVDNNTKNGNTLFGIYLQDEWKATDKLTVNYGERFDAVNAYVNEQQFSPRLGAIYKTTEQTTVHAGYARYFTPPPTELVSSNTLTLFNGTTNAPISSVNSPVKSERGDYYDAGVTHQLTRTTALGLDSFYKQTQNTLDEGQFGPALLMTPFNYAEGKIYGVELTADYKSDNLTGYANLARTVSMATNIISSQFLFDQATLNYAANNWVNVDHEQAMTISTGGSYLWSGIRWSGDVIYESGLRNGFANTTSLPGYTVVNLGAVRKMSFDGIGKIDVRLVVNNAFDSVYEIRDGSGIGVFAPQYGPRRGVFLGLSKKF